MIFTTTALFILLAAKKPEKHHVHVAASKKAQFKKEERPLAIEEAPKADAPKTETPVGQVGATDKKDEIPSAPNEAPPVVDPLQYTYNPFGKRDPFRSFLIDRSSDKLNSSDPLLNYDLSKFTLTGILWGLSNPKAIVKDGDGHGHIISRGTRIGRNKGQVIRILKQEVVVAEEYRDPLGKLMVSEYSMKLEKEGTKK